MPAPVVLRDDFFRRSGATPVDPAALTGFPATRLRDDADWRAWRPSGSVGSLRYTVDLGAGNSAAARALAILGHNLGSQSISYAVDWSDTGTGGPWTGAVSATTPPLDRPLLHYFTGQSAHRYWSVELVGSITTALHVSEVLLGQPVVFPYGIRWPGFDPLGEELESEASRSVEGFVVRQTVASAQRSPTWAFDLLPWSFVGDTTVPTGFRYWWENHAMRKEPSAFAWWGDDPGSFSQEAVWGRVRGELNRRIRTPVPSSGYWDLEFEITGLGED